jgi:enediyne biosynthesis protein E5
MTPEQARLGALLRFATAITLLTIFGHALLGFEGSILQLLVCAMASYCTELILEAVGAWSEDRRPAFLGGGFKQLVIFLLPAHITAFAIAMLIYPGDRLLPMAYAAVVAIASKSVFTVVTRGRRRHFLNPSNFGIVATIFVFTSTSFAAPYEFTENIVGIWDWVLPCIFICTGTFLNYKFTKKLPLIVTWVAAFCLQAVIRHYLFPPTSLYTSLGPVTGVPFLLYTFYMITDPQTSPSSVRGQIIFALLIAAAYMFLLALHVEFTLFIALFVVCVGRGIILYVCELASFQRVQASAERLWLTFFGRPSSLTSVPRRHLPT